jgi:hypothetical protein
MARGLLVQQHYRFGAPVSGYCPLRLPTWDTEAQRCALTSRERKARQGVRDRKTIGAFKLKLLKEKNMEPTITQNSALYLANRKVSKRRAALFRRFRTSASKQGPDAPRQLTSSDLFIARPLHEDNGR